MHTIDCQSRSPDPGPKILDALMQVFLRIRLVSPHDSNFSIMEPTKRLSSLTGMDVLCSPCDERDAAKGRQDKFWRLIAVLFSASHECLGIRDVDLTYHPPRGYQIQRSLDCDDQCESICS